MVNYLNDVKPTDVWITNCREEDAFGIMVVYQAKYPDQDVFMDIPKDMSRTFALSGITRSMGASQKSLIQMNYYGIYSRSKTMC